jgi:RHS repeat-associated protein
MIHFSEKTRQLPDRGITLPFMPTNILMYLAGQNETLACDLSMPTTTIPYAYDATCSTLSCTTAATTINHYDTGNSSINTGKTPAIYDYDNICDRHQSESRSKNKSTYADSKVYYYGYRYYSPELGRWVSKDPIGERGFEVKQRRFRREATMLYSFVFNNPAGKWDLLGLKSDNRPGFSDIIDYIEKEADADILEVGEGLYKKLKEGKEGFDKALEAGEITGIILVAMQTGDKEVIKDAIDKLGTKAITKALKASGVSGIVITGIAKGSQFGSEIGNIIAAKFTDLLYLSGCNACICEATLRAIEEKRVSAGKQFKIGRVGGGSVKCWANTDGNLFVEVPYDADQMNDSFVKNLMELFEKPERVWAKCPTGIESLLKKEK